MVGETVAIEIPKDSFRRYIVLNIIKYLLEDGDVNFGNDYYITSKGIPITFNNKAAEEINILADKFPKSCHILTVNSINELLAIEYPKIVKLEPVTKLWYIIQNDTDNMYEAIETLDRLKKQYRVYEGSDSKYSEVLRDILNFECVDSKITPNIIFIKNRPNINFINDRDFPIVTFKFKTDIQEAKGLLWIFSRFREYTGDRVDFDVLSKIDYNSLIDIYMFPHISETLTNKILDYAEIDKVIGYQHFENPDLAAEAHLGQYFNYQSFVLGSDLAWMISSTFTLDAKFAFQGSNDEDPITMEPFSELTGKRLLDTYLSPHKHNYNSIELNNYFSNNVNDIRILPYDRDPCIEYIIASKLCSAGILPYHNKQGLYSSKKQYVLSDEEWKNKNIELEIYRYPYYKDATIVSLHEERSENYQDLSTIIQDPYSGYYTNIYTGVVYTPDGYIVTLVIKIGPKQFQKLFEYIDYSAMTDSNILKAIRNGLFAVGGFKYDLFKRATPLCKFSTEDSFLNEYLFSVIKKYMNNDL